MSVLGRYRLAVLVAVVGMFCLAALSPKLTGWTYAWLFGWLVAVCALGSGLNCPKCSYPVAPLSRGDWREGVRCLKGTRCRNCGAALDDPRLTA